LAGCSVLQARAGDWTQWRGSNRDLIVSGETLLASWPSGGPRQAWQVELPGDGYAEPVVVGGKIYITGNMGDKKNREGHLFALEAKTGKIVWQVKYGPEWAESFECSRTSPTVVDGRAYVVGGLGHVVCVDTKDGKVAWAVDAHAAFGGRNITWGIADNPLIYDGKVICQPGGPDASIVALDAKTGEVVWKSTGLSERSAYCSPALLTINGKRQVVTFLESNVVGVDAKDGRPLWKYPYHNKYAVHPNTPVLCGKDRLFLSSGYKYGAEVVEVSGNDVKRVWFDPASDNHFQGVAFYKGRIFSSGGGQFTCFDPENGKVVYHVAGAKKTSFCITPAGIITYDESGGTVMLVKAEADTHSVISSFKIGYGSGPHWSSPVVSDGMLYLRHGKGFAAYEIGAK
jgi:outer membrane protein assembly factor BamB